MEFKNVIKYEYLNDLLYIFSGALANAWLSTEFSDYGKRMLFLDNYLLEGNTFLYIVLYLSFSFVLGVFLRELGEYVYMGITWILKKFTFSIKEYGLGTIPEGSPNETEDDKYFRFRHVARINAHLVFTGFFFVVILLWVFLKGVNYWAILVILVLLANSVKNVNQTLRVK